MSFGEFQATAVRVKWAPDCLNRKMRRVSGCGYSFCIECDADLAAKQIEQYRDALAINCPFIDSKTVVKRAFQNANLAAELEIRPMRKPDQAG